MSHYDEETLALLALGETDVTPDQGSHLTTCEGCRREVDQLAGVVAIGRSVQDSDVPIPPPPAVWDRVVQEIQGEASAPAQAPAAVVPLTAEVPAARRGLRAWPLAAAAVLGLVVGAGATWALTNQDAAPSQEVAQGKVIVAALQPVDAPSASGTAELRVVSSDQRTMTVTVANLARLPGTFYEVWMMDPTDSHLLALGALGADGRGTYTVPAGLDITKYSAVDVSLQPMNGSPEHSKNSAVRGTLPV